MAPSPADSARLVWGALVRAQSLVLPHMHRALQREHALSLSEYTVLQQIAYAGGDPASMSELRSRTQMSAAGITRVVHSLTDKGLVMRARRAEDQRLMHAGTTSEGARRLAAAERTVDAVMAQLVASLPSGADFACVAGVLSNLGDAVLASQRE